MTTTSGDLKQCWMVNNIFWHWDEGNFAWHVQDNGPWGIFENHKLIYCHISQVVMSQFIVALWHHMATYGWDSVKVLLLMAPSHYLNLYWLVISEVLWHSPEGIFRGNVQNILDMIVENLELQVHLPGTSELIHHHTVTNFTFEHRKTECTWWVWSTKVIAVQGDHMVT